MAKPKVEKKKANIKKLVREYWQSIELEDEEMDGKIRVLDSRRGHIFPPSARGGHI